MDREGWPKRGNPSRAQHATSSPYLFGKSSKQAARETIKRGDESSETLAEIVPTAVPPWPLHAATAQSPHMAGRKTGTGSRACTAVLRLQARGPTSQASVCLTRRASTGGRGRERLRIGLVENGRASSHDGRNPYCRRSTCVARQVLDAENVDDALRPVIDTQTHLIGEFA